MPELPEQKTTTTSGSRVMTIGASLPVWNSLSQSVLEANGWVKVGKLYMKGENVIDYTGVHWILNGETRIEFLEDLENNKTPGD